MRLTQGEIADRITILMLKIHHGLDAHDELRDLFREWRGPTESLERLYAVNKRAWSLVEIIYKTFDHRMPNKKEAYGVLIVCYQAYLLNKERVAIKNEINAAASQPLELKTWKQPTI